MFFSLSRSVLVEKRSINSLSTPRLSPINGMKVKMVKNRLLADSLLAFVQFRNVLNVMFSML